MTKSCRSGSIQIEVPVKPVWPKERGEKSVPAEEPSADLVSQPRARSEPGILARRVKSSTTSPETMRRPSSTPPFSSICAKRARSPAVLNNPA